MVTVIGPRRGVAARGAEGAQGESAAPVGPIVAFDFDGTLTCRDSFVAFLLWSSGAGLILRAPMLAAAFIGYLFKPDRGALKARLARIALGRIDRAKLSRAAGRFHAARAEQLLRPDALARWNDWISSGARVVIVTASPEILIEPFAKALGAYDLIGTRLAFDEQNRYVGRLDGLNCRGAEKVVRLKARFGETMALEAAYGDTAGDTEMLAAARRPGYRIFHQRP